MTVTDSLAPLEYKNGMSSTAAATSVLNLKRLFKYEYFKTQTQQKPGRETRVEMEVYCAEQ